MDRDYDYLLPESVFGFDAYCGEGYEEEKWWYTDYENVYVSDCGRVFNANTGHMLKPKPMDKQGHLGVMLCINGHNYYVYVHRLMAKAFIPNPDNYPIVRHLDDEKWHNDVENLAWGTQKDNHLDSVKNGTFKPFSDEAREKSYVARRKPVLVTDLRTGQQFRYRSLNDAVRDLGVQQANACKVLSGQRKHTQGYFFEYLEG